MNTACPRLTERPMVEITVAILLLLTLGRSASGGEIAIEVWYGDVQRFGHLGGHPQRWVNVLGHAEPADRIAALRYTLNGSEARPLSFVEDRKRIARDGDFNVEIARTDLRVGSNTVVIEAIDTNGGTTERTVVVEYVEPTGSWPLPYRIDWSEVGAISDAAQVVDGHWRLTPEGVRTVDRYYDRVLAFGDANWRDVEVTTTVTVHAVTPPRRDPNTTNVTHAAIALRWPGHEADGLQPSVQWYPLGATAEFRLGGDLQTCRWRIFDGKRDWHVESPKRRAIGFETPYRMKHRVETLDDGRSRYRVKFWPADQPEPEAWDLQRLEPGDLPSGSALLIAHHADVTFGDVEVVAIGQDQ